MSTWEEYLLARVHQLPPESKEGYLVYILRSYINPSLFYCGSTNNIHRRLRQHNGFITGGGKYTSANRPWEVACVIYSTQPMNHGEALRVEYYTKAKNYNNISQIPTDDAVARRVWLIKHATEKLDRQSICFVLDADMQRMW